MLFGLGTAQQQDAGRVGYKERGKGNSLRVMYTYSSLCGSAFPLPCMERSSKVLRGRTIMEQHVSK